MQLRPYQQQAVREAGAVFASGASRFTVVLPCGTGKSAVAATSAQGPVVVQFVPTIALLQQSMRVWRQLRPDLTPVLVCSARPDTGDDDVDPADLGWPVTTDPGELGRIIDGATGPVVIHSTYASSPVVEQACRDTSVTVDTLICDEAHRTAGAVGARWQLPVTDIAATRRLFVTATPREVTAHEDNRDPVTGDLVEVASMSDPARYGPRYAPLTLRQAITDRWLSDYRVAVVAVDADEAEEQMGSMAVTADGEPIDLTMAAAQIALCRYAATHPDMTSVLAFCNRVDDSRGWAAQWPAVVAMLPEHLRGAGVRKAWHVDGSMTAAQRNEALAHLNDVPVGDLHVVSNCKVLSEGVDVPSLDAVMFAQPRTSAPDIVQIVGRALRRHPGDANRKAVVVIPVLHRRRDRHDSIETVVSRTPYFGAWQVLTALAHEDQALYRSLAYLAANPTGTPPDGDDGPGVEIDLDLEAVPESFREAFALKLLHRTTNPWTVLAVRYRDHIERGGNPNPQPSKVDPDGYPLGRRIREVRQRHKDNALPAAITDLFDAVPGWSWTNRPQQSKRTFEQWCDLVSAHLARTQAATVRPWETHTLPDGTKAPVGRWLASQQRSRLDPAQQRQLDALVPDWDAAARH